jgi:hypothetical protein
MKAGALPLSRSRVSFVPLMIRGIPDRGDDSAEVRS